MNNKPTVPSRREDWNYDKYFQNKRTESKTSTQNAVNNLRQKLQLPAATQTSSQF